MGRVERYAGDGRVGRDGHGWVLEDLFAIERGRGEEHFSMKRGEQDREAMWAWGYVVTELGIERDQPTSPWVYDCDGQLSRRSGGWGSAAVMTAKRRKKRLVWGQGEGEGEGEASEKERARRAEVQS